MKTKPKPERRTVSIDFSRVVEKFAKNVLALEETAKSLNDRVKSSNEKCAQLEDSVDKIEEELIDGRRDHGS